jgi:hypothetical protein
MLTFTIAGVDRTALVKVQSLSITDQLNSRNTASFTLEDATGAYRPVDGSSIVILNGATRIFAGSIDKIIEDSLVEFGSGLRFALTCVDYNQLADRHLVARNYETANQTLKDIVLDIVAQELAGEGITTTNVSTGPVVQKAIWNYVPAATAFDELAALAGYSWWIDYNKDLHFSPRDANPAPIALTDTSANYRKLKVTRSREQYRNQQFVRAGNDLMSAQAEGFTGDGKTRSFPLRYPIGAQPTALTVNGVSKTIGIGGVDTGKDFYWNKGDPLLKQDSSGTLLVSTDVGSITYQGEFPIIVNAQADAEITTRAGVEGGTGIYQEIEYYPNINSSAQAQQIAVGLLQKFGTIPVVVEFETDVDGLFSGQLLPITSTAHALAGNYLIAEVRLADFTGKGDLRYRVKAYDGQFVGSWEAFFRYIASIGKTYVIRENEVVVYLRTAGYLTGVGATASESLTLPASADTVAASASESMSTPTQVTPEWRVDFALTDLSETH